MKKYVIGLCFLSSVLASALTPEFLARRLWQRAASSNLKVTDPQFKTVVDLIKAGEFENAALLAVEDDNFYNITIRHWAQPWSNKAQDSHTALNDFVAMVVGVAANKEDFRRILYEEKIYAGPEQIQQGVKLNPPTPESNAHYQQIENSKLNLRKVLRKISPVDDSYETAGVLSTRAWGEAHLNGGTNRRAIEQSFKFFLCTPLEEMADASLPDSWIHRDVDRKPGGNTQTFLQTCKSCHAGMDGLVGAYAYFNFDNFYVDYSEPKPQKKYNQNGTVYKEGYVTLDNSWENMFTEGHNKRIGWKGPLKGKGLREYGRMLSNAQAFNRCMVKKVFAQVCQREATAQDQKDLDILEKDFENSNFQIHKLFAKAVVLPQCLGR